MKIIVGLGNPGRKYRNNRHNLGFRVVDELSDNLKVPVDRKKFNSEYGKKGTELLLVKPTTYMNDSGKAVISWVNYFKIDLKDLLVVCDDFTLKQGVMRFRRSGMHGGHNGLRSVITSLDTNQFSRLRMGVGSPKKIADTEITEDPADYVLKNFDKEEKDMVDRMIRIAAEAVKGFIENGIGFAMNIYNRHIDEIGKEKE